MTEQFRGGGSYCVGDSGRVGSHPFWENVSLSAVAWNGTAPYRYVWIFGDGTPNASGAQVSHTYRGFGPYRVVLAVSDATGSTNTTNLTVPFYPPPGPVVDCPSGAGWFAGPTSPGVLAIAGGVAAVAVILGILVRRRRRAPPGKGPTMGASSPPSPP
jgi:hypothetical protein